MDTQSQRGKILRCQISPYITIAACINDFQTTLNFDTRLVSICCEYDRNLIVYLLLSLICTQLAGN